MSVIEDAIAGKATLKEVEAAFTISHPYVHSRAEVRVSDDGKAIDITGAFLNNRTGHRAGVFSRRIEPFGKTLRIYHDFIKIELEYQRHGIAWLHYATAVRFYKYQLHAHYVYMDADDYGPYVWPDFGFEFPEKIWAHLLGRLESLHLALYGEEIEELPDTTVGLLHMLGPDGSPVGQETIRAVQTSLGPLRMNLFLNEPDTVGFLQHIGIL